MGYRSLIVFCAVLAALLAAPAVASAADLTTVKTSTQSYGHAGGRIVARATVKARTRVRKASTLRFYLSSDQVRDSADLLVSESVRVGRLRARRSSRAAVIVSVPQTAKVATYYLIACADDLSVVAETNETNNCRSSKAGIQLTADTMTSRRLIDAAVERGQITPATGLAYRVYAAFGDPRLPARLDGDDIGAVGDDAALRAVTAAWPTLPRKIRAALRPFYRPPLYKGSWAGRGAALAAPQAGAARCDSDEELRDKFYVNVPTANGKVRIWWRNGTPYSAKLGTAASRIAKEVNNSIWPKLTALMGRAPLSDAGVKCYHGEDGRYDIYLYFDKDLKGGASALTIAYDPARCTHTPAFTVVDVRQRTTRWEIAHELFHAIQFAYTYHSSCKDYEAMDEATATWAGNYVYPSDDLEHEYLGLLSRINGLYGSFGFVGYNDWTFFYSMTQHYGNASMRKLYANTESFDDIDAIDHTVPGGIDHFWPVFIADSWNQAPLLDSSFWKWDVIDDKPCGYACVEDANTALYPGTHAHKMRLILDMGGMEKNDLSDYRFEDPNVRYIKFKNPGYGAPKGLSLLVLVQFADGHWSRPDWLHRDKVTFCRDDPSENVKRIVTWYGNSLHPKSSWQQARVSGEGEFEIRDACESYTYKILSASLTTHATGSPGNDPCALGGFTTTETRQLTSQPVTQPTPLVSKLESKTVNGTRYVSGKIEASIKIFYKDSVTSCQFTPTGIASCSFNAPEQSYAGNVRFDVDYQPWTKSTAQLKGSWDVPPAEIGVASGSYVTNCIFPYLYFSFPPEESVANVPLTQFTGTTEQTIAFSGSKKFEKDEGGGYKTTVTYDWVMKIKYLRVDENGNPL